MINLFFPKPFKERYKKILGDEAETFYEYCEKPLRKSIRINTLKADKKTVVDRLEKQGWKLKPIPWCNVGYWVEKKGEIALGNTQEHFMGYFYVQEASSMIPPLVLAPKAGETVLDVSAAPGSKTTQMAEMMKNTGALVANDPNIGRIRALRFNLDKGGVVNTVVNRQDGGSISKSNLKFDKILFDAPCSAEGTVRKDYKVLNHWGEKHIKSLSRIQKRIILPVADTLKNNGTLVYSTCTLAPEENEEVISFLLEKRPEFKVEKVILKGLKTRCGITSWDGKEYSKEVEKCARIYPQDNDSEGFFVAKIVKDEKASNPQTEQK